MDFIRENYIRLRHAQTSRKFKLAATVVIALVCGGCFAALLVASYDLDAQRRTLVQTLSGQNLQTGDEHAVSLAATGTVTIGGRTWGGETYKRNINVILDENGRIRNPVALAEKLISDEKPAWAPQFMLEQPGTTWLIALVVTGALLAIVWMEVSAIFLVLALSELLTVAPLWLLGFRQLPIAMLAGGALVMVHFLLKELVLLLYDRPIQVLAVAYTVINESARTKLALVFVVVLLGSLPLLPIWIDQEMPLRFQIQTYISRSMGLTFLIVACLTLFLSTASVAFEIRDRQIWQLFTKPLNRLSYLVGKWLGVVTVNLILLVVAGVAIFVFVQYLRTRPVASGLQGQLDAMAVNNEVLTARLSRGPDYDRLTNEQLMERVDQRIRSDSDLSAMEEVPLPRMRRLAREVGEAWLAGQRTIPPQMQRTYLFSGLEDARARGGALTLRYRFHILEDDEHTTFQAYFWFNDDQELVVRRDYVPTMTHVLPLPTRFIQDDGTLRVTIANPYVPSPDRRGFGALNFEAGDFEIMYKVGNFEPNFVKAMLINWVKLGFLAMLGVVSATCLSFSVACLLSFTVFIAGIMGPYLAESLAMWYPPPTSQMDWGNIMLVLQWAFQWFIKAIAELLVWSLQGFAEVSATRQLVEGKFISWMDVFTGFRNMIVVWSGVILVFGWWVIRSRQLAIYSGQG